jgi:diguanylate cyclase (GGDEF)-like protein
MEEKTRRILIVDDVPQNIQLVASNLQPEGYQLAFAQNGTEAISQIEEGNFDLVLLDVMMPDLDGFSVCRKLKSSPQFKHLPVIFLTAKTDKNSILEGFNAGGVDYITKPFSGAELVARVKNHLELLEAREKLEDINVELNKEILKGIQMENALRESEQKLKEMNRTLEKLARTDPLTQLSNRRNIMEQITYEQSRAKRSGHCFSLVIADIDNFKSFNDKHGHDCGDQVLKEVSQLIKENLRAQDQVARWGGEEFLLLLPETELEGGIEAAEKIRKALEEKIFTYEGQSLSVTMTFGVKDCQCNESIDQCINAADMALYKGKEAGRNRVAAC